MRCPLEVVNLTFINSSVENMSTLSFFTPLRGTVIASDFGVSSQL